MANLELGKERKLLFYSQVDQKTISDLTQRIIEINDHDRYLEKLYPVHGLEYNAQPIKIIIDSYGGNIYQMLGCIGVVENSKTKIQTIATGAAMSCGFLLLIAGHERFCFPHATPLYHQAMDTVGRAKMQDLEEEVVEMKRLQNWIENFTLRRTLITKEELKENKQRKIDWYFSAKNALKYGVVDKIITEI